MLLANETVARELEARDVPALYRVHEAPDPLKVKQFEEFLASFGLSLAAPPEGVQPRHFQRLVDRIRGRPAERPIAFLMLRTMQKARYDPANLGHFGLAADTYTHFTSPIRRYPDLVVHRLLREVRHRTVTDERRAELAEELPEVGRHTSEMERRAEEAERELLQWKKVRFMADKVGEVFDGYITGVAPFGLFVELGDHYVEGLVHVGTMADDYYRFREQAHALFGENTKKTYRVGDKVQVQIVRVDMERRQIDLGLADILEKISADERPRGPRRTRVRLKKERRKGTHEERRRRRRPHGRR
jgi:ribonuclease R